MALRRTGRRAAAALLASALGGAGALAELPALEAPEGAVRTVRLDRERDHYDLPIAPAGAEETLRRVHGRVVWEAFRIDAAEAGPEAVASAYRARLEDLGFDILLDCAGAACGGLDFRFALTLLPAPEMVVDAHAFHQISAERRGEAPAVASVLVSRALGRVHVQTVTVDPAPVPEAPDLAPAEAAPLAEAEEIVLPRDEASLRDRLLADGHLPIEGLAFETGGARLSESSGPALDLIARLLRADDALSVVIVGHSDNRGGLDANRALSLRRAEAVRAALVERGVPAAQMSAEGVGFLAPVASNATAEGRALNRRVELVLR